MQFLSALSFLGLMTFIGFSMISKADIYDYDDNDICERCEVYDEYDETVDPQVIINNIQINNYNWINVERRDRRGHTPHYPPAVLPYPHPYPNPGYYRPICRIGRAGWGNVFDLWVGNQLFQRGPYGVVVNSYQYLAATGQCLPR